MEIMVKICVMYSKKHNKNTLEKIEIKSHFRNKYEKLMIMIIYIKNISYINSKSPFLTFIMTLFVKLIIKY